MYSVSIRNIEKSAVPRMKPATFAPRTVFVRRIPKRISGSLARFSQSTKPTSSAAEAAKTPIVRAELQPQSLPCVIARTRVVNPPVTRTAPGASKLRTRVSRLSESSTGASASAASPTGMLTKKIHSQERASVSTPPSRTPAAAPKPPTAPQTPSAMFRCRPSANVVIRIASAAGEIVAAPRPWIARAPISEASDQASPQRSEPIVKTTSPIMKIRRRPRMSAVRPPSSRKPPKTRAYAEMTHCRLACENPRSVWIEGRATFTIAMSSTTMNCTAASSASANHFKRGDVTMRVPSLSTLVLANLQDSLAFRKFIVQNVKK